MDENQTSGNQSKGMNWVWPGVALVVIILAGAGFLLFQNNSGTNQTPLPQEQTQETPENPVDEEIPNDGEEEEGEVKEFEISGRPFSFTPNEITVNQGDTVRITFTNEQGTHNLMIDEFNAGTEVLGAGQSETIEFVADRTGEFEFYCGVMDHRQRGMVGTLIVE